MKRVELRPRATNSSTTKIPAASALERQQREDRGLGDIVTRRIGSQRNRPAAQQMAECLPSSHWVALEHGLEIQGTFDQHGGVENDQGLLGARS